MMMLGKTALVKELAKETGLPKRQVRQIVEAALEKISSALSEGTKVSFKGFGTFRVVDSPSRVITMPNGQKKEIPARKRVKFVPSIRLK
jgi:DNA-binding protein HU-beta